MYPNRVTEAKKIDGFEISKNHSMVTITRDPNEADKKYAADYRKKYGVKMPSLNRPIVVSAYYNAIPGCCSGVILSRLAFPSIRGSKKKTSIASRARLLKLLMAQFNSYAIMMYIIRSDNKAGNPKVFTAAGWKKSRGPAGRYSPYNYTLDTYTVDPRTPKRKLPNLKPKKKEIEETIVPTHLTLRGKLLGTTIEYLEKRK